MQNNNEMNQQNPVVENSMSNQEQQQKSNLESNAPAFATENEKSVSQKSQKAQQEATGVSEPITTTENRDGDDVHDDIHDDAETRKKNSIAKASRMMGIDEATAGAAVSSGPSMSNETASRVDGEDESTTQSKGGFMSKLLMCLTCGMMGGKKKQDTTQGPGTANVLDRFNSQRSQSRRDASTKVGVAVSI